MIHALQDPTALQPIDLDCVFLDVVEDWQCGGHRC